MALNDLAQFGAWLDATGHADAYAFVLSRPGAPLRELAREAKVSPFTLQRALYCAASEKVLVTEVLSELVARSALDIDARSVKTLPVLWRLRPPWKQLVAGALEIIVKERVDGWSPGSGTDPLVSDAFRRSLSSLRAEDHSALARGETHPQRGDAAAEAVAVVWDRVSIYNGGGAFLAALEGIPDELRHLLCTHWCTSEVKNGGFDQFFFNDTGVLGPEAAAGFSALGMPRTAEVIERALAVFGSEYPRDRFERQGRLEHVDADELAECSSAFYRLVDQEQGGQAVRADKLAAAIGYTGSSRIRYRVPELAVRRNRE